MFKRILIMSAVLVMLNSQSQAQELITKEFSTKGSYGEKKFGKAPKKVYIAKFQVYFHVIASATATSTGGSTLGGGSIKGNTKTTMTVALDGVDLPEFQRITDETYQRFVNDLKSKGFEIMNTEDAAGIPFYEDWIMKEGGEANYANIPGYIAVTPSGTKYMVKNETRKGREKGTFIDRTPRISKELDNAIVVEATFAFPFIEMNTSSSSFVGFSSVKARTDFKIGNAFGQDGLTAINEYTLMKFTSGSGPGASANAYYYTWLKKPIDLPGVFKDEKFKEFSAAASTPAYYPIVFVENKNDKVTNTATCDPEKYVSTTTKVINEYIDKVLAGFYENAL